VNAPSVSIIVPAFNAAAHLPRSLGSVAAVDYPRDRLQVVVVDDGSSDATAQRARELLARMDCETRLLCTVNGGPSRARNAGLEAATGTCIQFLDADDEISRGKLGVQAPVVGAEVACAYSRWKVCDPDGREAIRDPDLAGDTVLGLIRTESFVPLGAGVFDAAWLRRVGGFDPDRWFIEDLELQLRLARAGATFVKVPMQGASYTYVQRHGSLSRAAGIGFYRGCVQNARIAEAHWRERGEPVTGERLAALLQIYENGLEAFAGVDPSAFERTLADVLRLSPGFQPGRSRLRALSRVIGVRNAYRLRSIFRHGRRAAVA
jgi:glycosyltransferase involved in cell wall biosynthesis